MDSLINTKSKKLTKIQLKMKYDEMYKLYLYAGMTR
jgi:hypothetical protein